MGVYELLIALILLINISTVRKYKQNVAPICPSNVCFIVCRMTPLVSRHAIFDIWSGNNEIERCDAVYEFILGQFGGVTFPDDVIKILKTSSRSLCQQIELKWNKCYRHRGRFLKKTIQTG